MNYAKTIKRYRQIELLTQAQLAKKLGVGAVSVSRWENNHFEPTIETKRKLAILFKEAGIGESE